MLRFQSPLHRGMCFDAIDVECAMQFLCSFSPLFIGACVSTHQHRVPERGHQHVSVPSSSGHVFRRRCATQGTIRETWFQSPLHRGMCFDQDFSARCGNDRIVSVPSSSGHVFRPHGADIDPDSAFGFQSPLHRGMCFDAIDVECAMQFLCSFSPLFIGACVSTFTAIAGACLSPTVSVPSSSGHVFRHRAHPIRKVKHRRFQSPLHRGMCFDNVEHAQ